MAPSFNKKHRKQCKKMSDKQLADTITKLEPKVRLESSLLECAKWEQRRRFSKQVREEKQIQEAEQEAEED